MQTPVIDTVAKYFFYCTIDEQVSFSASLKALSELKRNGWLEPMHRARWVQTLTKWRPRLKMVRGRAWARPGVTGFLLPMDVNLDVWATYLSAGEPTEVEAVLLSKILGFTDEELAEGLGVTVGTVRYRVGRGLRHLGGYLES